ncbi:Elongation of very long chain fatty acids protein 7 (3-keto acyl-CoA synthase Elovl7) (ELOVL fatty acid elongase 7) (ELOVL FA elongase 7) (Very long chain 3-ketoacyl-CoA synthase 7) (Very long chain 3-oxoacyl-CoA synthase 7) [Durusdinium trenchii]|uniref:PNPLA domain-containing protein n=1 Tax=Durusdinium trenchii TaxID=1381693 RepID=A0ABP0S7A0_9DINO
MALLFGEKRQETTQTGREATELSAAEVRRRALMLVDVLVEHSGRLKRRWVFAAGAVTLCYVRYVLPVLACWGSRRWEQSVDATQFEETVGGHNSQVSLCVLVVVSLGYFSMLHCSARLMEARLPVQSRIFEMLVVYNMAQLLFNAFVCSQLLREAYMQGFTLWGNIFMYTKESHRLGYFIWLHYHGCQLELIDTLFVVIRKKFQKITFLHVWLRLINMWGWFFPCRYACGGDTYFPASVNSATRAVVYGFYSWSLLTVSRGGTPLVKVHMTELQMFQFAICTCHALSCMYNFWNMQIPRVVLVIYFLVMMNGLMLYTDFHHRVEGKSEAKAQTVRKVSIAFDSSGWVYCYHFGVATWLQEHMLPPDLTPETATTNFPANLIFSGSSGGALVAATLATGLNVRECMEMVLKKQPECMYNPFRVFPAAEDVLHKVLPDNAHESLSGRLRVLLTRVSFKYPFLKAQVVNQFSSKESVFHTLRASCHIPMLGGVGPYFYNGNAYFDGMFWPQFLVPWKGTQSDLVIRVAAVWRNLSADIVAPSVPTWWALLPPEVDALRGLYWQGYSDAARWFTQGPQNPFDCLSCRSGGSMRRRPSKGQFKPEATENKETRELKEEAEDDDSKGGAGNKERKESKDVVGPNQTTLLEVQKLLVKKPADDPLPEVDPLTGRSPLEYIAIMEETMRRQKKWLYIVSVVLLFLILLWIILGWF